MSKCCDKPHIIYESPDEAKRRWDTGEDDQWYEGYCRNCQALHTTGSDRWHERRIEDRMKTKANWWDE